LTSCWDSAAIVSKTSELLPEPEDAGEHGQPALRDVEADFADVVLRGTADLDAPNGTEPLLSLNPRPS
jgi:hypothetical protein